MIALALPRICQMSGERIGFASIFKVSRGKSKTDNISYGTRSCL